MTFHARLTELIEKATKGPWRKSTGNIGNGIEADSGKRSPLYGGDDGYRMVATYQACEATGKYKEEEENQAANGDLIIYLVNHAEAIRDVVAAAEKVRRHSGSAHRAVEQSGLSEALAKLEEA